MNSWDGYYNDNDYCIKDLNFIKESSLTFNEAKKRAEGYLSWIGATYEYGLWNFDKSLTIGEHSFLVYDGKLVVNFGHINGDFICFKGILTSTQGLPLSCSRIILKQNNLNHIHNLPIAKEYILKDNNICHIKDNIFSKDAIKIDISKNSLSCLPNMTDLNLEYFDCSKNIMLNLNGSPKVSGIFNASNNMLSTISDIDLDFEVGFFDISYNELKDIINLPRCVNLNLSNNKYLTSIEGLKHPSIEMTNLNISNTAVTSLKGIYFPIEKLEINDTKIKDFSCKQKFKYVGAKKSNLYNLKTSDLEIEYLIIDEHINISTFYSLYNIVNEIKPTEICLDSYLLLEINFFNLIKKQKRYINKLNYYKRFLDLIYRRKINLNANYLISTFKFPKSFYKHLYNLENSNKTISKFSL